MVSASDGHIETVLELGSGGGNNASHLKHHFTLTLTDLSADMLAVSRTINPECEHIQGDMRTLRLGREFDAVFVHDAIAYLTSPEDLRAALETVFVHCKPGGVALVVPDGISDTFASRTDHGGNDGDERSLRYLEWTWDPDPADGTYLTDYAYLLRDRDGSVRVEHDRHVCGLFSRAHWLSVLKDVGFRAENRTTVLDGETIELFVAVRSA